MKKLLKISIIPLSIMVLIFIILFSNFYYSHNTELTNYFESYNHLLSSYVNSFEADDFSEKYTDDFIGEIKEYDIPPELQKINVCKIEYFDSCIFFEVNIFDAYYGGIYYSYNNNFANSSPAYCSNPEIFYSPFKEVRKGIFVKGKKNTGTNWYKTEKLEENWYYYEFH